MNIYYNSKLFNLSLMKGYAAITLPWGIYVKYSKERTPVTLIKHEMIHMEQRARLTTPGFYILYLWYYFRNLIKYGSHSLAYYNNTLEVEAYVRQNEPL